MPEKYLPPFCRAIALSLLLYGLPAGADYPIEVIQLKARPLDEILPVIEPLIGADGSATGMGNSLVLKAAPARVEEIRKLLLEIDRPPRRLVVTVKKHSDLERSMSGYSASADIEVGDGQISINSNRRAGDGTRARLRVYDTNDERSRIAGYQVQALEGRPAFIASGARIPVYGVERYYHYGHPHRRYIKQLYHASSGFYVIPRVNGGFVTLDIRQHDDRPDMYRDAINTQATDTVIRARLGEWIRIGGIDTSSQHHQGGLARSITTRDFVNENIEVMVECLDCDGR